MHSSCLRIATSLAITLSVAAGCATDNAHSTHDGNERSQPSLTAIALDDPTPVDGSVVTLWVHGMSCPKCVSNVDLTLSRIRGVSTVTINMREGLVVATLDGTDRPTRGAFARAVDDAALTLVRMEVTP